MTSSRLAGRRIKELRVNRGFSPEQLGARVGVSGHTIRRVETGKLPTPRTQFLIAQEFELLPTDLWPLGTSMAMAR